MKKFKTCGGEELFDKWREFCNQNTLSSPEVTRIFQNEDVIITEMDIVNARRAFYAQLTELQRDHAKQTTRLLALIKDSEAHLTNLPEVEVEGTVVNNKGA